MIVEVLTDFCDMFNYFTQKIKSIYRCIPKRLRFPLSILLFLIVLGIGIFYAIPTRAVPGDFAVYRETTAFETITTTPSVMDFTTTVSEGSVFSIDASGEKVTLSEQGHYLALYNLSMETISGTNRSEIQGQLNLDGWIMPYGRSTCYFRRTEDIDECWMAGAAIFESTSTNQALNVESYKTDNNTAGVRRRANESGFMLVRLDDDWDYARVREVGGGQPFNTTSWSTVSWDTNDELDANYSRTDGDITLGKAGHYMVTYTLMFYNSGAARRNNETRLTLDGYELPGTRVTAYTRTTNSTDNHVASFVGIIEATTTNQVLRLQGVCEVDEFGNVTGVGGQMGITIAKLPETAEYVRLGYSSDDQLVDLNNAPFSWDTQYEVDTNSFSHNTSTDNSRINIAKDGDYLFLSSFYTDRTSTTDTSRLQPHWKWRTDGGTVQSYGSFAKYNRGDYSTTGTYSGGASGGIVLPGLTSSDYIEITTTDEGSGTDLLAFFDSPKLGIQGVRLDSLITPDIVVQTIGTQNATSSIPNTNFEIGASYFLEATKGNETITDIKVTENGSVDAQNNLSNVRLYYDLDTTSPYDCASESYDGTESQFGATSTFPGANGSTTFSDNVSVGLTSQMCVYVVFDVTDGASDGDTVDVEIANPFTDVVIVSGTAGPKDTSVPLPGTTTLVDDELTQIHFHWRNDDGSESGATSATGGSEDSYLARISKGTTKRVRFEISNEGSLTSPPQNYRIEYAVRGSSCSSATGWTDVGGVGGAWDMSDSLNLIDGNDTTNISVSGGGVTDENITFLTSNGAVKDTSSQTGALSLTSSEFLELEYSIVPTASSTDGEMYCFRLTNAGTALANYDVYPSATIASDVVVSTVGTQTTYVDAGEKNTYLGGSFSIVEQNSSRNVTSIAIKETGTIDAQNNLPNVRMYYELDSTSPYDCTSESYDGTEAQFGATSTFSGADGTVTFNDTVGISTTSSMCVYVVSDISDTANNGDTIDIEINNPGNDVQVSTGTVNPNIPVAISGTTTVRKASLEQLHFHWRNDDGSESGATSATDGVEDTDITRVIKADTKRLRVLVSNEGATTSTSTSFSLEYGKKITTCSAVSWKNISDSGGDWTLSDSPNVTDGVDTTNISVADGGVTDENTTFLTPNGAFLDTSSSTGSFNLASDEFLELEYSIEATPNADFASTYCFRVVGNDSALKNYSDYPEATLRQNQDFYIQRGTVTLNTATTTTIYAGTDYVKPSASTSAFIRITNTQITGAGRNNLGGVQNADTVTVHILNPSNIEDSITFYHAGTSMDTRVDWEIVEYTGPVGGDNEMKVRAANTYTYSSADLTGRIGISGVNDGSDVVVFITGQSNPDVGTGNYNTGLSTSDWDGATNEVVLERAESGTVVTASYAVVEFTGSNWVIQRAEHTYSVAGAWETESITTVNDIERTFLHVQKRSSAPGLDEFGHEVYLSDASTVRFQIQSGADSPSGQTSVAWIIENTQTNGYPMQVHRTSGSNYGGAEPLTINVSIGSTTRDLTTTSIFINNRVTGTGTAYPRPIIAAKIVSTTTYQLWISDTGQTVTYRTEVVDWPTAVLTMTQDYYRFYVNNDALDPTDPWPAGATDLGENTAITGLDEPPANGDRIRVRMSVQVSGSNVTKESKQFKLEYGVRNTSCSAITNWLDVGDSASTTAVWRGYNSAPLDGTALSGNPPTSGDLNLSVSDRAGTYEESSPTVLNPYKIFMGEDVEYDWLLQANDVTDLTSYCFRMTEDDGTLFNEYLYYPTVTTVGFQLEQQDWRWYDDEDAETPIVPLAASNTAPSNISQGNALKLRILVEEQAGRDGDNTKFKLQYSEFSDFSSVYDVDDMDTCTDNSYWCYFDGAGNDNATITTKVLDGADVCVGGVGDGCGTHNEYSYAPDIVGEVGTTTTDSSGTTITLGHVYDDPIFIAEAISGDSTGTSTNRPAVAIITATSTSSFTVRIQEPDNESDTHGNETVAYIVMERGAYFLPDGRRVDVNSTTTDKYYGNSVSGTSDDVCVFNQTFSDTPVVYTALQSNNNTGTPDFLTVSQTLVTASDFACSIEVPDGETNTPTNSETIGWIAIEQGEFTNNEIKFVATTTSISVTGWDDTPWYEELFDYETFSNTPGIVASKQTRYGAEGGWVRYDNEDKDSVLLAIDERDDGERVHTSEQVGYLAFSKSGFIYKESPGDFVFTGGTTKEFEYTILHNAARSNVTYFFRLYNIDQAQAITATTSTSYPSLSTEGATLSFSISGLSAGSSTEGVTMDATTTATSVPFGSLTLGVDKTAGQRLTVTTNASEGYQVLMYERQDLTSGNGATIQDISGTNDLPVPWSTGCATSAKSCYGYHAGDNTLSGGSTRFLLNDTYAALTGIMSEVAYSSGPVSNESTDVVYKIRANTMQPAGQYEGKIVYIIVPVF